MWDRKIEAPLTSYMQIMVRVASTRAQAQMAALRGSVAGLNADVAKANAAQPLGMAHMRSLNKFGNQLQWTGRMLLYNFTLPIIAAGAAATKWAMDNEKAMTRVQKVYGDTRAAAAQFRKESKGAMTQMEAEAKATRIFRQELAALEDAFTAISNHYGVQKKEVLEVASAWAAAGVSGVALAKSVDLTMKAIIIGDMDAAKATESLIAIQGQFNLSTQELNATLAIMNSIENQTAVSMADLIDGFSRSAGMARQAGVSVRELGAMMAALVPATGSAASAGNALKTLLSRLVAPTKEAAQVMKEMGLNVAAASWQSLNATERLKLMAKEFDGLHASAQNVAASVIASRWQVNRFAVLMKAIVDPTSMYAQALDAAKDQGYNFTRMQKELNTVLQSDPRRMQRMWVMIQNGMTDAIIPIIPHILYLVDSLAKLTQGFAELDPKMQKIILYSLLLLAAIGPLIRYVGALVTLYAVLGYGVVGVGMAFKKVYGLMKPVGAAFLAMGTYIGTFLGFVGTMVRVTLVGFAEMTAAAIAWATRSIAAFVFWNGGVVAAYRAAWASLIAITAGSSVIITQVQFMFGALQGLFVGGMGVLQNLMANAWIAMYVGIKQIVIRGQLILLGLQQSFFAAMYIGSAGLYGTLQQLFWAFQTKFAAAWLAMQTLILRMWMGFGAAMVAVQAGISRALTVVWAAMHINWAGIAAAGAARITAIWTAASVLISRNWLFIAFNFRAAMALMWFEAKKLGVRLIAVLTGPWGIAIAIIVALLYTFRDQIKQVWENISGDVADAGGSIGGIWSAIVNGIVKVFNMLPQGVQDVMVSIVTIIRDAALAVYDWFQYINPWAQHSPSLVDNVTTGMDRIVSEFGKLSTIKQYTQAAYAEIKRFSELTKNMGISSAQASMKEDRKTIKKAGGGGAALASYNKLQAISARLNKELQKLETRIAKQEQVVEHWQKKVDQANRYLEKQQDILDTLGQKVDKWQNKLDNANERLQNFANTPLKGMRAMEDAIFANDMASKRLRLSMMDLEDVYGTFDDIKSKIDAIHGAQELISGQKNELRAAGAGSEILGQFDKELDALDKNRDAYQEQADKLGNVQKQIDALARQAERLDLTKSLNFDGLQRQIDQAVNSVKEMSFKDIMAGIKDAQADVALYTNKLDDANRAFKDQQVVVDQAIIARDNLQGRLDAETAKLDNLKNKYDEVNEAIQAIASSIQDVVSAAEAMNEKLAKKADEAKKAKSGAASYVSPGLEQFRNAGNADFPDTGGSGMPSRKDWSSQVGDIEKFTEDLAFSTSDLFAQLNPFEPLKEKAKAAWEWIKAKAKNIIPSIGQFFEDAFKGVDMGGGPTEAWQKLKQIGGFITGVLKDIGKGVKWGVDFILPELKAIWEGIKKGTQDAWKTIGPKLASFKELVKPLGEAFHNAWEVLKPILAVLGGALMFFWKGVLGGIAEAIGPLLDTIGKALGGIIDVIKGIMQVVIGIFTLDGKMIMEGFKNIFIGAFTAIVNVIKAPLEAAYNFIIGFFKSIWDGAVWLYDELIGHSIIPDIVNGIVNCFKPLLVFGKWVWDHILKPVAKVFIDLWKDHIKPELDQWWPRIKTAWAVLWTLATWVWNNVLKPIKDAVLDLWRDHVRPELDQWLPRIKTAWTVLAAIAGWLWENVLKPIFNKVIDLWTEHVRPELDLWQERIKNVWHGLTNLWNWVKINVMDPIFGAFKDGWTDIKTWFENNADFLTKPVGKVVNGAIAGVNFLIKGLNKISSILPGIDFHIDEIPTLARGGPIPERRAGRGFITNGARAIVGEGKPNHPEYVIPTDPTHRRRATMLLHDAAKRIGFTSSGTPNPGGELTSANRILAGQPTRTNMSGVPMYDIGGVMGWVKDKVGNVAGGAADWMVNKGKNMASFLAEPFFNVGRSLIDKVGWVVPREISKYGLNQAEDWIAGVDKAFNDIVKEQVLGGKGIQDALAFAKSQVGKPYQWGGVGPDGYDCSGFMSALTNVVRGNPPYHRVGATGTFPWPGFHAISGTPPGGAFIIGSSPSYSGGIGHMAGTLAGVNVESAGGVGVRVGPSARGWMDSGFTEHAYLAMKEGGVALRRSGGTPIVAGDGRYDEAVVPLPKDWRAGNSGKNGNTFNFYGNLEFPNITDGNDAETFVTNLENLVKD